MNVQRCEDKPRIIIAADKSAFRYILPRVQHDVTHPLTCTAVHYLILTLELNTSVLRKLFFDTTSSLKQTV